MPFKSKAQMKKMAALEQQGKVPKGTFDQWKSETGDESRLPERAPKKPKKKGKR